MTRSDLETLADLIERFRESRGAPDDSDALLAFINEHPHLEEVLRTLA